MIPVRQIYKRCLHLLPKWRRNISSADIIRSLSISQKSYTHLYSREGFPHKPSIDMNYIINNQQCVKENILTRKSSCLTSDVDKLIELWNKLQVLKEELKILNVERSQLVVKMKEVFDEAEKNSIRLKVRSIKNSIKERKNADSLIESQFYSIAVKIPNRSSDKSPLGDDTNVAEISEYGRKPDFNFNPIDHVSLGEDLNIIRTRRLSHLGGHRLYYLEGAGTLLEQALIRYSIDELVKRGFYPTSVPDIIKPIVFEGCGMLTESDRTQVFHIDENKHGPLCLAGTSEVPLVGYYMNSIIHQKDLPHKRFACSTCYRAETPYNKDSGGLFRVHQFTKVEMFGVTSDETGLESEQLLQEILDTQIHLFSSLKLHFKVLEMPTAELGNGPAFRKIDMEAWMPGRESYGEISSASNCLDYQSRRLHVRYDGGLPNAESKYGQLKYCHTVNGTACAVPRLIIAILENYQKEDGSVIVPDVLQPYMYGLKIITKDSSSMGEIIFRRSKH